MSDKVQVQKNSSAPSQMAPSSQFQERPFTDERYQTVASTGTITADSPPQPNIARASFNLLNMPIFAPSPRANVQQGNIQRQEEEEKQENLQLKEELDNALPIAEEKDENQEVQLKEESDKAASVAEEKNETQDVQLKEEELLDSSSSETSQEDTELESIQTKLAVGKPGDKYEQEADSMATKVMAMPDSVVGESIQRQTDDEKKEIQTSPVANFITPLVQRSPERRSNRKATRTSTLNSTLSTVDPLSRTRGSTRRTTELNELGVQPLRRNLKQQPYKQDINGQELWNGNDRLPWGNDFEENYWQNVPYQLNPQRNNRKEYQCIVGSNNQIQYLPRSGDAQPGEDIATIGHRTQWRDHILNNAVWDTFTVENDGTQISAISKNEAGRWYRDLNNLRPEGQSYNSQKARPYTSDPLHQEYEESNNPSSVETPEENIELKPIQTKLTVGKPGDKYEQEADTMAAKVMAMPDSAIGRQTDSQTDELKGEEQLSPLTNSISRLVQRQTEEDSQDLQMKLGLQRSPNSTTPSSASIESSLANSKGGGSPLPDEVRSFMEPRFGADFSSVRVHTDSTAVQMNKDLGAQAFAHGSDIYFGAGKSPGKNELTAHELTHTVQQGGAVRTKSVTQQEKKENKLQAKADTIQLTALEPKIQRKEDPQAQPAKVKVATPAPHTPAASPAAESAPGTTQTKTIEKPAAGGDGGGSTAPAGGGGGGAVGASSGGGGGGNSPGSAQNDPGFKAVVDRTKTVATQEKNHPPAGTKSAQAQAAAVSPANEVESKAQDKQVQEMNLQQPGQFNAGAFKAALMEKIAAATPQTLEEADNFKDQNKLDSVKGDLSSQVGDEKKQAANPIAEKTKEQPDTSGITPKPVTPLPPKQAGKAPSDIGANKAAPKPKSESEVSLQEGGKSIDKQMADADITEPQLAKSNEPQFQTALETKKTAQTHANTAPNTYRQQEQGIVTQAQAQAQTTAQSQLQGMHGEKEQLLTQVVGLQTDTKGQDEQKRSQVANHIQGIYNNTKQRVETALSQLDGEVNQQFDSGAAAAKTQFENYVDQRMKRYKDDRYSGVVGKGKWVKDKLFGMPSEVNAFYQEGKNQFLASMDKTIDKIASNVATKLNAAKAEITKGKQEIQKYVASLDPSLRQVGQEAAQNIGGKFDELEQSVDNKQNELIDSLAQKYNENLQALDSRINEMKAANRGLVDKAMDAMGGVIKTILEMKNLLMGVLAKAAGAIEKIILDPIGFLGNLVSGLKQGFQNFQSNIGEHLQKGLVGWLTGTLASTGLQMPESFDIKGILSLVTQVLGTTYQAIRPRAVKAMGKNGEKTVSTMESSFEMFVILKNEGVGGLWQFIQDKIGDLKSMVIDTIKSFVIETVIKQGIMWILSLLNPASAFVRACKAIIDIIMFFIERGSQIVELVNAVIDSVTAIANGAVGGAAKAIENALSKALPVVIGFMASLLGLGGITGKIQDIIKRVRQPIEKAIDWVIAQAVKFAKKIGNKLGFGKGKGKGKDAKDNKDEAKHREIAQAALGKVDKEDQGQTTKEIIANKKKVAQQEIQANKGKLSKDVNFSIKLLNEAQAEKEEKLKWKAAIVPNDTVIETEEDLPASEQDLKKAKAHFGDSEFEPKDMISLLSHLHVSTVRDRMKKWKQEDILFEYASHTNDRYKKLSFSSEFKGKGVRPVSPGNRQLYGYINPDKRSAVGIEILSKGLKTDEPGYSEAKKLDLNYHLTKARYICKRSGKVIDFENAILGHHNNYGASEHWNDKGHKQTRNDNKVWNQKAENYQGPEDKKVSSASGAESARYEKPGPPDKPDSHPMWWDTTHPDYAGK
ncbi:DUF4157 domain-containing protein [Aerosakkonemataceae cyanobacterium BLCC-F50]|uniref:DUF4157 domain-containing protein n=1 Tax=Floridaenema flaviceps BLCC-F50 TaxID=3153642 RepID=A0ABV4XME7_9CYAN